MGFRLDEEAADSPSTSQSEFEENKREGAEEEIRRANGILVIHIQFLWIIDSNH